MTGSLEIAQDIIQQHIDRLVHYSGPTGRAMKLALRTLKRDIEDEIREIQKKKDLELHGYPYDNAR